MKLDETVAGFLGSCISILRYCGLWQTEDSFRFYIFFSVLLLTDNLILLISQLGVFFLPLDVQQLAITTYLVMTVTGMFIKSASFIALRSQVDDMLSLLGDESMQAPHSKVIREYKAQARRVFWRFQIILNATVMVWCVAPLFNSGTGDLEDKLLEENNTFSRLLPLKSWYPFDAKSSPNYEIVYTFQVISVYFLAQGRINIDVFFISVILFITAQLEILNLNISQIGNSYSSSKSPQEFQFPNFEYEQKSAVTALTGQESQISIMNNISDISREEQREMYRTLKRSIIHHQIILRSVSFLQNLMSKSIFFLLLANMISICIYTFLLSMGTADIVTLLKIVCNTIAYTFENALYCWYGHGLMSQSEQLTNSAFGSNWISGSGQFKGSLRIFMIRSNNPLKIIVGKMYHLSRETFLMLLNGSYSLFNILYQINNA